MSEWKKVKLGDVSQYVDDKIAIAATNESYYVSTDSMLKDKGGIIDPESIPLNGNVTRYQSDDILVSNIRPYFKKIWFSNREGGCSNDVLVFRAQKYVTPRYLYYILSSNTFFEHMMAGANGTKMPRGNKKLIMNYSFELPSLPTQHRIATILSRYDSLIENYQKQIKLLEEAAQRLYKEWFVDLHFPGHENTKIVEGVPEGWKKKKLGQLAEFKRGKTITKKEAIEGSIPVVAGGLEPAYYCDKSNTTNRVITISGSGANAGYTRMYFEKVWASDCSFADTSTTDYLHFVFCFLQENKTVIDNMQKGAAQPHVYAKDINSMELLLPIKKILFLYEQRVSRFFDTIESLQSQISLLTEARDRLLPKLMGGEIKIESLN